MRKILTAIICSLLLPAGVAMAMSASDKKDDKKGEKEEKKEEKKEETTDRPVVIVWEFAWPPIYRLASDTCMIPFSAQSETEVTK